jgi:hypothetical protein
MKLLTTIVTSIVLGMSVSASAQDAPPADGKGMGPGHHRMKAMDCSKAPADMKERCEMRNKALETCKGKKEGEEHRKCMMDQRPKKDAAKEEKK